MARKPSTAATATGPLCVCFCVGTVGGGVETGMCVCVYLGALYL